jgi:hypothetical protein
MPDTVHSLLSGWSNFYVISGSAAAALTGLQFVVMSLLAAGPSTGAGRREVDIFVTPTIFHFCAALLTAALLTTPWPALSILGWSLGAFALVGVGYAVIVRRRVTRQTFYAPAAEDWLWHTILPMIAYAALFVAAIFLQRRPASTLFVIAAVELVLLFIGIHNAWDLVAEVAVAHRARSRAGEPPAPQPAPNVDSAAQSP